MRKEIKKNIIEILDTVFEAHSVIEKSIDLKKNREVNNLLADCQETAINIGGCIEKSEGENCDAIYLLNEYCKTLYDISVDVSNISHGNNVKEILDEKLYAVKCNVENIKVKLEVVFMPYKASMWDSLESVWKAADEDPECDAYVVPIPYYDRNPDHSFGDFHYEGDEYPDYVPVVHYNSYNLKQRKPDIIYIHNPYDGSNFVTSVHPNFYSSELKKYTDKLVYIPYFVSNEPEPKNLSHIEHYSRYALTSGVINANKVVVQSEAMREVYVKALLNYFGNTPNNKKIIENKILGIGSPKFDRIKYMIKDNIDIPENWRNLITRTDGSMKKVVLFNTGLGTLLNQNEKVIDRIKEVFEVFYNRRDKIVLLWRPHPLIQATIQSMRPQLWNDYKKLLDMYIDQKWGIYDNTSDFNRAIVLSDVYIGDYSSIIQMYKKTGKPVYLFNYGDTTNSDIFGDKLYLNFTSAVRLDDKFYFTTYDFNGLFSYDVNTELTHFESCFEKEVFFQNWLYTDCIYYNNKIYFFPALAECIAEYDVETHYTEYYKPVTWDKTMYTSTWKSYRKENYIYIIPFCSNQPVYRFDLNQKKFEKCVDFINNSWAYTTRATCFVDNKIYIAYTTNSTVYELNLNNNKLKSYSIESSNGFWGIDVKDKSIWLISEDRNKIIKYNMQNNSVRHYVIPNQTKCMHICCMNDFIWTCAEDKKQLFKLNATTEIFEIIELDENEVHFYYSKTIANNSFNFCKMYVDNDDIVLYPFKYDKIIRINTKTSEIKYIPVPYISKKWYEDMIFTKLKNNNYNIENIDIDSYIDLSSFVDLLLEDKISNYNIDNTLNENIATNGMKILKRIKQQD